MITLSLDSLLISHPENLAYTTIRDHKVIKDYYRNSFVTLLMSAYANQEIDEKNIAIKK